MKIGINGFGRIGRSVFKILEERGDVEVVAINNTSGSESAATLLRHDSVYGEYDKNVTFDKNSISVNGHNIQVLSERDPSKLPWGTLGVDVVVEVTGKFNDPKEARAHIKAGAKKVVLSAPAQGEGATTIVLGVNDDAIEDAGEIISCASCTTNCIAPVMSVLQNNFDVEKAMMSTIHSYTSDQRLLDNSHKDPRRARAAAINIVPTKTGASTTTAKIISELDGKFDGISYRVPTATVSVCDIVVVLKDQVSIEKINETLLRAAREPFYQGILSATTEELVSSDFIGNPHSAIVDLPLTQVVDGNLVRVVAWYDNEWGYSNRLAELSADVARSLLS